MQNTNDLKAQIRQLLVDSLMLQLKPEEIADDISLFGEGLGLDSVDALQLVVALEKTFGLKIKDADMAREVLKNVNTIAAAVEARVG
jgi:acyl carrier protein